MSKTEIIAAVVYLIGYLASYNMLRIEQEAEEKEYTRFDRILGIVFSILSWIMVIMLLVSAWFKKIGETGYWDKPVKREHK